MKVPLGKTMKLLKRVSVFSCVCTTIGVPLLAIFGAEGISEAQRVAVTSTVVGFAFLTTGTLHYFAYPYVTNMYYDPNTIYTKDNELNGDAIVEFETMNIIGSTLTFNAPLKDIKPSEGRVWANFEYNDRPFYVHDEKMTSEPNAEEGPFFDLKFRELFLKKLNRDQ